MSSIYKIKFIAITSHRLFTEKNIGRHGILPCEHNSVIHNHELDRPNTHTVIGLALDHHFPTPELNTFDNQHRKQIGI